MGLNPNLYVGPFAVTHSVQSKENALVVLPSERLRYLSDEYGTIIPRQSAWIANVDFMDRACPIDIARTPNATSIDDRSTFARYPSAEKQQFALAFADELEVLGRNIGGVEIRWGVLLWTS